MRVQCSNKRSKKCERSDGISVVHLRSEESFIRQVMEMKHSFAKIRLATLCRVASPQGPTSSPTASRERMASACVLLYFRTSTLATHRLSHPLALGLRPHRLKRGWSHYFSQHRPRQAFTLALLRAPIFRSHSNLSVFLWVSRPGITAEMMS